MDKEVIKFGAEWCASCTRMSPTFKEVSKEFDKKAVFKDIDVETDEGVDLSTKYQVRNVPTILVIAKDRVIKRISGTRSKQQLIDELKEVL